MEQLLVLVQIVHTFIPAAYSYVLGIEDMPTGGYINYDQDGPIYTFGNLINY